MPRTGIKVAVCALIPVLCVDAFDPGFGLAIHRTKLQLQRREPAAVRLANVSISVKGVAATNESHSVVPPLVAQMEAELLQNERTLRIQNTNPEWTVMLTVTRFSASAPMGNAANNGGARPTGALDVAYKVLDRSGHPHDAGNVAKTFEGDAVGNSSIGDKASRGVKSVIRLGRAGKEGPVNTRDDLQAVLVRHVVHEIAANLGNTTDKLDVYLAKDKDLEIPNRMMEKKLYRDALEHYQALKPYPNDQQDAYRIYNIAVANEALAYDAIDAKAARSFFYAAQEKYEKAFEMKKSEEFFLEPQKRIRDAIARYKVFEGMSDALGKMVGTGTRSSGVAAGNRAAATNAGPTNSAPPAVQPAAAKEPAKNMLTLDTVVELVQAGTDEPSIIYAIDKAEAVEFNPANPQHLLKLSRGKVPVTIQNALRKKVGAPPLGAAPKPAAPKPAAPATAPATKAPPTKKQ